MTHVDDDVLQRLLHGELDRATGDSMRTHIDTCHDCRERVAIAQRDQQEILQLLQGLDQPARAISVHQVMVPPAARGFPLRRVAALLVISAGALAAAYIAPGSPLRRAASVATRSAPVPRATPAATVPSEAGVSVDPGNAMSLLFVESQRDGVAFVSIVDGNEVDVRTTDGAARFTVENHRILIDNHGASADFRIRIGRSAPRVELRVGGHLVLSKAGDRIETSAAVDGAGQYRVGLRAP